MAVVAYIWRRAPGAEKIPAHEAVVNCELAFALKLKGLLEHLDSAYSVTFLECGNYRPLHTTRPAIDQEVLGQVNEWLHAKGFPPVAIDREGGG